LTEKLSTKNLMSHNRDVRRRPVSETAAAAAVVVRLGGRTYFNCMDSRYVAAAVVAIVALYAAKTYLDGRTDKEEI